MFHFYPKNLKISLLFTNFHGNFTPFNKFPVYIEDKLVAEFELKIFVIFDTPEIPLTYPIDSSEELMLLELESCLSRLLGNRVGLLPWVVIGSGKLDLSGVVLGVGAVGIDGNTVP